MPKITDKTMLTDGLGQLIGQYYDVTEDEFKPLEGTLKTEVTGSNLKHTSGVFIPFGNLRSFKEFDAKSENNTVIVQNDTTATIHVTVRVRDKLEGNLLWSVFEEDGSSEFRLISGETKVFSFEEYPELKRFSPVIHTYLRSGNVNADGDATIYITGR